MDYNALPSYLLGRDNAITGVEGYVPTSLNAADTHTRIILTGLRSQKGVRGGSSKATEWRH